jgi:putative transposase
MLFLLSLVIRTLARALASGRPGDGSKDLEVLVLRHQVRFLRRRAGRPKLRRLDRVLLASASRVLPRARWGSFMVTPSMLLQWHTEPRSPIAGFGI